MEEAGQNQKVLVPLEEERGRVVWLEATVANPANPKLHTKAKFLVDTGADMTIIPAVAAERLQLKPVGKMVATLAAGKKLSIPLYYVYVHVAGEGVITLVGASPKPDEYLLGVDIMELLALQVDLAHKRLLKPVKRIKVKKLIWSGKPWKT